MKVLNENELATVQGGFPWASLAAGALCAAGILTAETGAGLLLAAAGCGASFLDD
jgi:bacteriocin-like protein